jgi:hypothetical protein
MTVQTLARFTARKMLPGTLRSKMRSILARLRRPAMERWLKEQRPEIYRRLTSSEVPPDLQSMILSSLAGDDYRRLPVWETGPKSVETDVLVVASQFSPDMVKDVVALRSERPGLHCTLLMGPLWWGQKHFSDKYFDEILNYGGGGAVEIIEHLDRISAKTTIVRGGRTFLDAVAGLFSPGRLVFRAEEWQCAIPGYDPESEPHVVETFLAGKADGIYHYWGPDATLAIRKLMNVTREIREIAPACVDELSPGETLPKLSEADGDPHVVFPADLTLIDGEPEHLANWQALCAQGIHVHYYPPRPGWRDQVRAKPYVKFEDESEYFHIEETVDFEQALLEFTQYDWAYDHMSVQRCHTNLGFEEVGPNLIYTFVQAELPMIIASDRPLSMVNRMVHQFDTGLAVSTAELGTLRPRMEAALDEPMKLNLRRRRVFFAFDRPGLALLVLPNLKRMGG